MNWLSIVLWWILPLILVLHVDVQKSNYVLFKIIELVILLQFIVVPLTYDQMSDKVCDVDFLLGRFNYTGNNQCSQIPSELFDELNCENSVTWMSLAISGFVSGFSLYLAYSFFKDVGNCYHKLFLIIQLVSQVFWMWLFHHMFDPSGPCYALVSSLNIARITSVFNMFIIILAFRALLHSSEDEDLESVEQTRDSVELVRSSSTSQRDFDG